MNNMKKITLILALSLCMISCNKYIVKNVYERSYNTEYTALIDIYSQLYSYDIDSVPMNCWMTSEMTMDTINISQKILDKEINSKSRYSFIFTNYTYPHSVIYQFLIRFAGKQKDL
jgi:hypothetical protein